MTSRNWPICSSDSSITSCPVTAVKPSGRTVLAASASSVWLTPSAAVRLTRREGVLAVEEEVLRRAGLEQREGGARGAAAVEVGGADELERLAQLAGRQQEGDLVADLVVAALGRRGVEVDLARLVGPLARLQDQDRVARGVDAVVVVEHQRGRAGAADELAVLAEQVGTDAVDGPVGGGDLGQLGQLRRRPAARPAWSCRRRRPGTTPRPRCARGRRRWSPR